MPSNERLTSGVAAGTIVVFVVVHLVAPAAGFLIALLVTLFVGLIAGGSVGFLVAGTRFSDRH